MIEVWTIGSKEYIIKSLRQPNKWLREWMPSCPLVSAGGLDFLLLIRVPEKHSSFRRALFSSTGTKANVFKRCCSNCWFDDGSFCSCLPKSALSFNLERAWVHSCLCLFTIPTRNKKKHTGGNLWQDFEEPEKWYTQTPASSRKHAGDVSPEKQHNLCHFQLALKCRALRKFIAAVWQIPLSFWEKNNARCLKQKTLE